VTALRFRHVAQKLTVGLSGTVCPAQALMSSNVFLGASSFSYSS